MLFHIALWEPEIPPNTGNIIRLCANTGCQLHLIGTLGFELDDKRLRRAGLDYREYATLTRHETLADCVQSLKVDHVLAFSSKATRLYSDHRYACNELLLFGPESRGLPAELMSQLPNNQKLTLPQCTTGRSLNLSNTVSIVVYEGWRQMGFGMTHN